MTKEKETRKRKITPFRLILSTFILFWVMMGYIFIYTGKVAAVEVISSSMEPTIMTGDRIIVSRYLEGTVERGQIVVLKSPDDDGPDLVKRVIGLPGDAIIMENGYLYVNGKLQKDSGGKALYHENTEDFKDVVPDHHYFVLGDNRNRSYDSTEFGPVDRSLINGLVWLRYSPLSRTGTVE